MICLEITFVAGLSFQTKIVQLNIRKYTLSLYITCHYSVLEVYVLGNNF